MAAVWRQFPMGWNNFLIVSNVIAGQFYALSAAMGGAGFGFNR